ncbi:MAG: hypothetical protein A2857_06190 [Candidatus Levybacteria bacterium RIFCSPHIGHO2_01_FULL_36_15]|nr:MAG: hypothetical protein A2857_06190 [Candidatus Levybacteria bacterium RIFCSPHIGHO2_01_FULL_36_15]
MKSINMFFSATFKKYEEYLSRIIFASVLFILLLYFFNLPYANIIMANFPFIPFLIEWIVILKLFRPRSEIILKIGLSLFIVDLVFVIFNLRSLLEVTGLVSYMLIFNYIIFSIYNRKY